MGSCAEPVTSVAEQDDNHDKCRISFATSTSVSCTLLSSLDLEEQLRKKQTDGGIETSP